MADRQTQGHRLGVVALAAGLAVLPLGLPNDYYLTVLIVAGFHTIVTMGLNLLMGYAGQVSLGHAAFYGIAAYTTGILTAKFHWPVAAGNRRRNRPGARGGRRNRRAHAAPPGALSGHGNAGLRRHRLHRLE